MVQRFHGIDRHKAYSTISVRSRKGKEIDYIGRCSDLRGYIGKLGPEDAVIMESSTGSFYWADQVETRGCVCYVLDPFRFKIIRESWNKCDKQDSRNMSMALWVYLVTGEFGLPTVYKPDATTRELRKLFGEYRLLRKQTTELRNSVQAVLTDNGVTLPKERKESLFDRRYSTETLASFELSPASRISVEVSLEVLWTLEEQKKRLVQAIVWAGRPLEGEVKLLISIRGITPFMALAFLADVGDVKRFRTLRKMNAYLGVVQKAKASGEKSRPGGINRQSRNLTRTLLTQSVQHIAAASPHLKSYYVDLCHRRGVGRARIALIRKICGVMRRMLLEAEEFRCKDEKNFGRKIRAYENQLRRIGRERKIA